MLKLTRGPSLSVFVLGLEGVAELGLAHKIRRSLHEMISYLCQDEHRALKSTYCLKFHEYTMSGVLFLIFHLPKGELSFRVNYSESMRFES